MYLRDAKGTLIKKDVEAGVGLIQWITRVFPQLRPYLCYFYKILAKAEPKHETWGRDLLASRIALLDKKLQYTIRDIDGKCSKTFRIYKLDNTEVRTLQEVHNFRLGATRRGKVCVHILDPRSKKVRTDAEASRVAAA